MLSEALKEFKKNFENSAPADVLEEIEKSVSELAEGKLFESALKIGDRIPKFQLSNATGKIVNSEHLLAKGPLVINFYRGGW